MGIFAIGDIVLVTFPFSDLSSVKLRPALVLAEVGRGDWILCQITSNPYSDPNAVLLEESSFTNGSQLRKSYARPGKLFTANQGIFVRVAGHLKPDIHRQVVSSIQTLLNQQPLL